MHIFKIVIHPSPTAYLKLGHKDAVSDEMSIKDHSFVLFSCQQPPSWPVKTLPAVSVQTSQPSSRK